MKKKFLKILSLALCTSMIVSTAISASAYDLDEHDNSIESVEYQSTEDEAFSNVTNVFAQIGSEYKVTIPKYLVLSGTSKKASYYVKVEGDIAGYETIYVVPESSVDLYSTNKDIQTALITQDKTAWTYSTLATNANGLVKAEGITAGKWSGIFMFNISINKVMGDVIAPEHTHNWVLYETTPATCTKLGEEHYRCPECTNVKTEFLNKTAHIGADPVRENEIPATYDAKGSYDEVVYCKNCGEELSRVKKVTDVLELEIPESAFDTSDIVLGTKTVKIYNTNNYSSSEIYNNWKPYPEPTTTDIIGNWIVNDSHISIGTPTTDEDRFGQLFIFEETANMETIDMSADIVTHQCGHGSGFVVAWNKQTDVGYVLMFNDNKPCNYNCQHGDDTTVLKRINNFSRNVPGKWMYPNAGKTDWGQATPSTDVAKVTTSNFIDHYANHNDLVVPGNAWYQQAYDMGDATNLRYTVTKNGLFTCYINGKQAFTYNLGENYPGNSGLYFCCCGAVTNLKIIQEKEYTQQLSVLKVNPNDGTYNDDSNPTILCGDSQEEIRLETPVREGYKFLGWQKCNDFDGTINGNEYKYPENANIDVLVARWVKIVD